MRKAEPVTILRIGAASKQGPAERVLAADDVPTPDGVSLIDGNEAADQDGHDERTRMRITPTTYAAAA
jgi:hypothetical protein